MNSTTAVAQSPATLKWLWMAVGALGVSVLALGGTLLAQNLRGDAPVAQAAQELGINRVTLSRVLNGKAGISIDLALRLESWLDGPTAENWLKGQLAYDLWQAEQHRPVVSVRHAQAA